MEEDEVDARLRGTYREYKQGEPVILFLANKAKPWCSLSNLAIVKSGVTYEGITYPSVEHAFQAQKWSRNSRHLFSTAGVYGNPHDNFRAGWTRYHNTKTPRGNNGVKIEESMNSEHSRERKDTMGILAVMVNTLTKPAKSRPRPFTAALGLEPAVPPWNFNNAHEELWLDLLRSKYRDPEMRALLLSTGDKYLIEYQRTEKIWEGKTNTGRDAVKFYSAYYDGDIKKCELPNQGNCKHCNDSNCNAMGKFLMKVRDELTAPRSSSSSSSATRSSRSSQATRSPPSSRSRSRSNSTKKSSQSTRSSQATRSPPSSRSRSRSNSTQRSSQSTRSASSRSPRRRSNGTYREDSPKHVDSTNDVVDLVSSSE